MQMIVLVQRCKLQSNGNMCESIYKYNIFRTKRTSTVGLPRESKISRALTLEILAMFNCVSVRDEVLGVVNPEDCPI